VFTEPLPSNEREGYRHTDLKEGFMKYAVWMGSAAMIYILSFINIGSGIQKLMWGGHSMVDLINLLLFFENKESWIRKRQINMKTNAP
jgi:hypothetical protein